MSHAERVVHKSGRWADLGSSSSCFASTSNIICRYKLLDTKKLSLPSKMFIQHLPMKKTNESHVEICQRLVSTEILILGFLIQFPSQGTWLCKGGEEDEVNIGPR